MHLFELQVLLVESRRNTFRFPRVQPRAFIEECTVYLLLTLWTNTQLK